MDVFFKLELLDEQLRCDSSLAVKLDSDQTIGPPPVRDHCHMGMSYCRIEQDYSTVRKSAARGKRRIWRSSTMLQ